jgi:hypothetical protein
MFFGFSVSTEIMMLMGIQAQAKYQMKTFLLIVETSQQNPHSFSYILRQKFFHIFDISDTI